MTAFRYSFRPGPSATELEDTLLLAVVACEALHGDARVRLAAGYAFDGRRRRCVVGADSRVGEDLNRLFAGLLGKSFGPDSYSVVPVARPADRPRPARARS
jgi:hypothetical protein